MVDNSVPAVQTGQTELTIQSIEPDVFIRQSADGLLQLLHVTIANKGSARPVILRALGGLYDRDCELNLPQGISVHDILIDELPEPRTVDFILMAEGRVLDIRRKLLRAPRHWQVHVVQLSHHDWGYTDIPGNVEKDHCRWLDSAIDLAASYDSPTEDERFRVVLEQCWSVDLFLRTAPEHRALELVRLMRAGRFELTATFGNMTTELMGHEQLYRALYPAFALKRKYGIDIVSAEHNDITGMSWGLCRVLTDAGIRLFCPGLPLYYNWGHTGLSSFWDQQTIFGHEGPGAFWWEAPSGRRLLLWCNNSGCGGDCRPSLPGLAARLKELDFPTGPDQRPYPSRVLRWPVGGAARDNSPFIAGYVDTVKRWNSQWAWPHLTVSTNARFYADYIRELPTDLPVWRGELAGQDYPVAATSTAAITAVNRGNHIALNTAEVFSCSATVLAGRTYPARALAEAREASLYHDEHVWGFHFPCGPAMAASACRKDETALRAAAIAHSAVQQAIAGIADRVTITDGAFHLVVFNPTQAVRSGPVRAPLREIDNAGSTIAPVPEDENTTGEVSLRGVLLGDRWHANPPQDLIEGYFTLIDVQSGAAVPCVIEEIQSPMDTVPWAAQRLGMGSGTRRYGFFEDPAGLKRDLCFVAADVPALGYRTYCMKPSPDRVQTPSAVLPDGHRVCIENEYYRVTVDSRTGAVISLVDRSAGRELVDGQCPHGFFLPVVRDAHLKAGGVFACTQVTHRESAICSAIDVDGSVAGHPAVRLTVRLYKGVARVWLDARILKDAMPLLTTQFAFPFLAENPGFRYEGCLSVMNPIADYLPGSHSDTIAVQNWVKVTDRADQFSVLWASLDAPVAGFGGLWPGYTSPAHRCVFDPDSAHPPLKETDLKTGWIFSHAFSNNYGTNFYVSQTGDALFRYVLTTSAEKISDAQAAAFGADAMTSFETIYTKHRRTRNLPPVSGFMAISNEQVQLIGLKQAEYDRGLLLRLWNLSGEEQSAEVMLPALTVQAVRPVNAVEEETTEEVPEKLAGVQVDAVQKHRFTVTIGPDIVASLYVTC